jgi:hypothetical protein
VYNLILLEVVDNCTPGRTGDCDLGRFTLDTDAHVECDALAWYIAELWENLVCAIDCILK